MLFLCGGFFFLGLIVARGQSPARFIENKNQWADDVHFVSRIAGGKMVLGPASFKYFFLDHAKLESIHHQSHEPDGPNESDGQVRGHAVFVNFQNADPSSTPKAIGPSSEYYNYYLGSDPAKWASAARAYEGVIYESIYPDIDLKVFGAGEHVKYDLVVVPGETLRE